MGTSEGLLSANTDLELRRVEALLGEKHEGPTGVGQLTPGSSVDEAARRWGRPTSTVRSGARTAVDGTYRTSQLREVATRSTSPCRRACGSRASPRGRHQNEVFGKDRAAFGPEGRTAGRGHGRGHRRVTSREASGSRRVDRALDLLVTSVLL